MSEGKNVSSTSSVQADSFFASVQSLLMAAGIPYLYGPHNVTYSSNEELVSQYICSNHMTNAAACYATICWVLESYSKAIQTSSHVSHALNESIFACSYLINLNLPLSGEELDVMIASCLYLGLYQADTYLPEKISLSLKPYLNAKVREINILIADSDMNDPENMGRYFDRIQTCREALLIILARHGITVRSLYTASLWDIKKCIYETRTYYFPLCIFGKANYPEISGSVSLLMEKMRNLLDVAEVMTLRYEKRETQLIKEILTLKEDNARISRVIAQTWIDQVE